MFSIEFDADTHGAARVAADSAFESLVAIIVDCQRRGLILRYEPRTAARIAWAQVHGIAELATHGQFAFHTRREIVEFARVATAALQTGLASPA